MICLFICKSYCCFIFISYFIQVTYCTKHFLAKNRGTIPERIKELFVERSDNNFVNTYFDVSDTFSQRYLLICSKWESGKIVYMFTNILAGPTDVQETFYIILLLAGPTDVQEIFYVILLLSLYQQCYCQTSVSVAGAIVCFISRQLQTKDIYIV